MSGESNVHALEEQGFIVGMQGERLPHPRYVPQVRSLNVDEAVWAGHPSLGTVREQIARASNVDAPKEACGFVLGSGGVVHCTNVDDAPWYRFRIDPDEASAWWATGKCVAMWHSHPTGPAVPSEDDVLQAQQVLGVPLLFMVYSVEDEDLATYRLEGGQFVLVSMESPA